ncbi:hypothetical protein G7068_11620 [Leucobacter viscericola]|uniref:Uncharacterized protein n=1 Tax=Leucobacter viscericola TaxID=2714935 RepID=A0A6G7XGX8_9MICO|nr:hypothetical protein [Leucobacter viscericola]QIK63762.1 hypothetical protein G7068_11620 [Leucobacter viscericola]
MDYGSLSTTGVLAMTGAGVSVLTGLWLPIAVVFIVVLAVIAVRVWFRPGKSIDEI